MTDEAAERQLIGAELWERVTAGPARFVAGWEDADRFCAVVCTTDLGLKLCRACPTEVSTRALAGRRAASTTCPAGVRLLAFPAPAGSSTNAAVLRVGPPSPTAAASVADEIRVPARTLRRAARDAPAGDGRATLAAARVLRDPDGNRAWQADQRARGSDARRGAAQALAQMIATSEEVRQLYRESRRQRAELARRQRQVDRLARRTDRARDEERSRIAHEIHDTAAQSMVSAFRFVDAARAASTDDGRREADPRLTAASDRLQAAIREVRAVLGRLLPPGLEELGLADALRARLAGDGSDGMRGTVTGELPRLEPALERALYGMASEAISNAERHSDAETIRVDLQRIRGRVVIIVADDGRGFDPGSVVRTSGGGLGLIGMSRQASWLGGSARVSSRPGHGTSVRLAVPIAARAHPGPSPAVIDD